ncbi:MAG: hypothetical protein LBI05_00920, partial [Planctomycetaceae bacterium]|nr:hypothetical protein [Planctomycetaceae bacterium]
FFDCVHAKKVTDRYAITKTSQKYQTLDRGTADTTDDVNILRGQTWISVNSPREGTTYVNAIAPNMEDWAKRSDSGIIHWVDAQWVLPRLAIAPVGESRVLTTTVLRATNGQQRHGWIVRYEILNGPAAGLGASGSQVEEVATDFSGQATTILTPSDQRSGTNTIGISIIRPAGVDGDRRITVGSEMVRQTWSGNPNILLNIRGPSQASLGQELPYEITAENRSSSAVQGVVVLPIPPLASYIRSEPPGILQGSTVHWNVNLLPNSITRMNVTVRQGTAGSLWLRPEFRRTSPVVAATPNPVITMPSSPNQSASVFPGTPPSPPPSSTPSPPPVSPPPAAVFSRPSLEVQIAPEPNPVFPITPGRPFRFYIRLTNTGTTDASGVTMLVPLPEELRGRGRGFQVDWSDNWESLAVEGREQDNTVGKPADWRVGLDPRGQYQVLFYIPLFSPGKTAYLLVEYPDIDTLGHHITCTVYAGGDRITQGSQQIVP